MGIEYSVESFVKPRSFNWVSVKETYSTSLPPSPDNRNFEVNLFGHGYSLCVRIE